MDAKRIHHYTILEELGGGGMGVVYKAEDEKLKRTVALKLLLKRYLQNPEAKERFRREAQAAARLDHPNICTIHEIGESEEGRLFIVMAYCEGETVKDMVARGALPLEEALRLTLQACDGLGYAHAAGVIHRDVKPANLMVNADGQLKIVDFGLAKIKADAELTHTGGFLGTAAFMSPEQARGEPVDARTDVWSLTVVLYEMATGVQPFRGAHGTATLHSVLYGEAEPLGRWAPQLPAALQRCIDRGLAKAPDQRYESMAALANDLRSLLDDGGRSGREAAVGEPPPSIAVLPFSDMSREQNQEFFCDGMAEELIAALGRIEGLRVASRTSSFQFKGKGSGISEIGSRLKVGTALEGSVRKAGTRLRILARLVDVRNGYELWTGRFDREQEDVFEVQDEIARAIVDHLRIALVGDKGLPVFGARVGNIEAYNAYLKGRYFWNKRTVEGLHRSLDFFREAVGLEPGYARAHAGLADAHATLAIYGAVHPGSAMQQARQAAVRALELDPTLAEAHTSLGCVRSVYEWSWVEGARDFERAIELDAFYATAYQWYAMNNLLPLGRFQEARQALARALELDPLSPIIVSSLGLTEFFARRYPEAVEHLRRALEMDRDFVMARQFLGQTLVQQREFGTGLRELKVAKELSGGATEVIAALGHAFGRLGDEEQARAQLAALEASAAGGWVSPSHVARIHAGLGDRKAALAELRRARDQRASDLVWLAVRPDFEELQSEPEFITLRSEILGETVSTIEG